MSEEIRKELAREVNAIVEEINNLENIEKFLNEVIDMQILTDIQENKNQALGFNITITTGGPNIYFIYERGMAQVKGYWGEAEITQSVDTEKAQEILDHINEIIQ